MTETTTPVVAAQAPANPWDMGEEAPAGAQIFGSGDHKTIGRLWIGFALAFGVGAWALHMLAAFDDVEDLRFIPIEAVDRILTGSQVSVTLLFAVPLFVGLATYVTPLQVGARTIAFPRAAAAALWSWLLGSALAIVGYAIDGGVGGVRARGVDLTYLGLTLAIAGLLLALVCILTTVVALRTPGMSLDRVPPFSWSIFVAGAMWALTLPVLVANMLLIYVDHHYGAPVELGLAEMQWAQLSWAFQPPQIFAYAIPVLGIVTEVVVTAAGARQARRDAIWIAMVVFAVLSFGAWAQPFFNESVTGEALFIFMGAAILVPILAIVGGWADTLRRGGAPKPTAALIGALGAIVALLLAGVSSLLYVIGPLELDETWFFLGAIVVFVLGSIVLGGISGLAHWAPKIWGRMANEALGRLAGTVALLGVLVAGLALFVSGFQARIDALVDASDALLVISAVGMALIGLSLLVTAASLLARGPAAGDDPWGGQSLEWATSSPPPAGNFGELALVTSPEPLLDLGEAEGGES